MKDHPLPFPEKQESLLASVVIHLESLNAGSLLPETGRKVHGFWHEHWKRICPPAAESLHPNNGKAEFTLSPIFGLPQPENDVIRLSPGMPAWFRVTTLRPTLTEALFNEHNGWLITLPAELDFGPIRWKPSFQPFSKIDAAWSWLCSYEAMRRAAQPSVSWKISLSTPTSFSGRYVDFTFPLPELLVKSWLERWNHFAPPALGLPEELIDAAREHLRVTEYHLSTCPGERQTIGCRGSLVIQAYHLPPEARTQLDLLFLYAYYCGSGHRTAQGMGQTRLLRRWSG
ncbi:hypothetical protein ADN00_13020 [Ornatilinea apprima]|uniref:CRISPR-associated protein Cas6 C-terminal domain-containing protein n=1 Tax=Ornatilinea apprima TaxID=1134406 RepID=A0A0P6XIH9_9CHLR|nr:CRISPR system precrRNA processing endoribonuclease RAMP protein Cas6 [Ornatilinea apprima]KPL75307.1 hypothetical protein ADN00_13020 [Ornatilinea apprima]